jgi:mannose-1-phosphate guanylyltransferase
LRAAEQAPSGLALVAVPADSAATDLGWIVPATPCNDVSIVGAFVEKPAAERADELLRAGGLWNTLVIAARGQALWELACRELPEVAARFDGYRGVVGGPGARAFRQEMYDRLPSADLSRDLLERAPGLAVVTAHDAGWSDCGTPERLFRHVHETHPLHGLRGEWIAGRFGARSAAAPSHESRAVPLATPRGPARL